MVEAIRIIFEGDETLRKGFDNFFKDIKEAARKKKISLRFIAGEATAVGDFITALKQYPDSHNILLIDSEGLDDGRLFAKLKERNDWRPPGNYKADQSQVLWMVQCMETWFMADPDALRNYYGQNFQGSKIPKSKDVEQIEKVQVFSSLKQATEKTQKGEYHKTRHAPELLTMIDPGKAKNEFVNCKRAFDIFIELLNA